jgi:hypothetical protein
MRLEQACSAFSVARVTAKIWRASEQHEIHTQNEEWVSIEKNIFIIVLLTVHRDIRWFKYHRD